MHAKLSILINFNVWYVLNRTDIDQSIVVFLQIIQTLCSLSSLFTSSSLQSIVFLCKILLGPFPASLATLCHLAIFWTCYVTVNSFLIIYCFRTDFNTPFLKINLSSHKFSNFYIKSSEVWIIFKKMFLVTQSKNFYRWSYSCFRVALQS